MNKLANRTVGLTTSLAVAATGAAVFAAPAQAAVVEGPTTTTLTVEKLKGEYGDSLSAYINSETATSQPVNGGNDVYAGVAYLQKKPAGSSEWATVATDDTPGYQYWSDLTFDGNATYRVYYEGAFYDSYPDDVTYGSSYSNEVYVETTRDLDIRDISKNGVLKGKFKATPDFGGKKFVFHKKVGKKWKLYKKVRANEKGVAKVRFPGGRKKTVFRVTVPSDQQFVKVQAKFSTQRY